MGSSENDRAVHLWGIGQFRQQESSSEVLFVNIRFPVLDSLAKAGNRLDYIALLNALEEPGHLSKGLLQQMKREGLISGTFQAYSVVKLEPPGSALYLQLLLDLREAESKEKQDRAKQEAAESKRLAEKLEDHAREERYQIEQKKATIKASIISALLALPVGMIIEYFGEILSLIASLFS